MKQETVAQSAMAVCFQYEPAGFHRETHRGSANYRPGLSCARMRLRGIDARLLFCFIYQFIFRRKYSLLSKC